MHWSVWTPTYDKYPGSWGEDPEPPEEGADVVFVEAETRKQALVEGVRALRKMGSDWLDDGYSNPFTGLKVSKSLCPHGICCYCEIPGCPIQYDQVECDECKKDWIRECSHEYMKSSDLRCDSCNGTRTEINALHN